jgi:iron complex outermembrane receptor protein
MTRFEHLYIKVSLLVLATFTCIAAHAIATGVAFDIPSGSAQATLKQFASEAHLQVVFDYRAVQKVRTPEVKGTLEPTEALKQMLIGSGLTFYEVNDHTIAIVAPGASTSSLDAQRRSNREVQMPAILPRGVIRMGRAKAIPQRSWLKRLLDTIRSLVP